YNKASSTLGRGKYIARFLPQSLARLFLTYLVYIRPLEIQFSKAVYSDRPTSLYEKYLFVRKGCLVSSSRISSLLQEIFSKIGCDHIGINRYRQVAISFMEKNMRVTSIDDNDDSNSKDDAQDLLDIQVRHSKDVALRNYAIVNL
ncbi:hypothetical protein H4219_006364, partial [Mycoemilia scoparia]